MILSYATKSADGCGEWWMWQVAGALRAAGISSYNGKQNVVGDDWVPKFFGKLPEATVFVAMISSEYFESPQCREEIYQAARFGKRIVPLVVGTPPVGLRKEVREHFFGDPTRDNIERCNVVKMHIGNYLPSPDRDGGLFQNNFGEHSAALIGRLRELLVRDAGGGRIVDGGGGGRIVDGGGSERQPWHSSAAALSPTSSAEEFVRVMIAFQGDRHDWDDGCESLLKGTISQRCNLNIPPERIKISYKRRAKRLRRAACSDPETGVTVSIEISEEGLLDVNSSLSSSDDDESVDEGGSSSPLVLESTRHGISSDDHKHRSGVQHT